MATHKSTIVWDDEEHPVVDHGMTSHAGSDAAYLRQCVEFTETHRDQESAILRALARLENLIRRGNLPATGEQSPLPADAKADEIFDALLYQLEAGQ